MLQNNDIDLLRTVLTLSVLFQHHSHFCFPEIKSCTRVNFSTMGGFSHCCSSVIRGWWQQRHPCYQCFPPGTMYFAVCTHTMNEVKAQNQIIFISASPLQELWLSGVVCAAWVSYLTGKMLMPCLALCFKPITRKPSPVVRFLLLFVFFLPSINSGFFLLLV